MTTAQRFEGPMAPTNILVYRGRVARGRRDGAAAIVVLRYNYTRLDDDEAVIVVPCGERWDPEALNLIRQRGAVRLVDDYDTIDAAIALLCTRVGRELPVQWNIRERDQAVPGAR